jgi:hypothetical protein
MWKVVFVCLELPFVLFCYQFGVKRKAVGIWGCKDCGKVNDEGIPNEPSIFVYLVFGPGGTTVEGIARPIH